MRRSLRLAIVPILFLMAATGESSAQYYGGWGGWGGGSTVQGDIARGMGYYAAGAGQYNLRTAQAASINADTWMRWNQYLYLSQQEANRREYLRMQQRKQLTNATAASIHDRLLNSPTASDINSGDALNVILDQLTDPKIHSSALRMANAPINSRTVRDIPFDNASEAVVISLHQLSAQDGWPLALRGEPFKEVREGYQKAVAKALKEDLDGDLSPETLQAVNDAAARVHEAFLASPPANRAEYVEAENYVKALGGMAQMLRYPDIEKAIAELEKIKSTTVGKLLAFMHAYNLRFGPSSTPRQREVYQELYPMLARERDRLLAGITPNEDAVARAGRRQPTEFFQGVDYNKNAGKNGGANNP